MLFAFFIIAMLALLELSGAFHLLSQLKNYHIAFLLLLMAPLVALSLLFSAYLVTIRQVILSTFLWNVGRIILLGSSVLLTVTVFGLSLEEHTLLLIFACAYILLFIITAVVYNKMATIPITWALLFNHKQEHKDENHWRKTSYRIAFLNMIYNLVSYLDLFFLEILSPLFYHGANEHEVGLYAACQTILGLIWAISQNTYSNIKPKIFSVISTGNNITDLNQLIKKASLLSLFISIILFFVALLFGNTFLLHFGTDYSAAKLTLDILAFNAIVNSLSGCSGTILAYGGFEKLYLKLITITLIIFVLTCIPLTYFFGMEGTAISNIIAWTFKGISTYYNARKLTKLKPLGFC